MIKEREALTDRLADEWCEGGYFTLTSGKKLKFAKAKKAKKAKIDKRRLFEDMSGYSVGEPGSKERIDFYAAKVAAGQSLFE
jgi:hypothetical protein